MFNFITETRENVSESLQEGIELELFNTVIEETFSEIDILATHHSLQNVYTETLEVLHIDNEFVYFEVDGELTYELQWGSNSDLARGDGLLRDEYFPFECQVKSNVRNLDDIKVDVSTIKIDTSDNQE